MEVTSRREHQCGTANPTAQQGADAMPGRTSQIPLAKDTTLSEEDKPVYTAGCTNEKTRRHDTPHLELEQDQRSLNNTCNNATLTSHVNESQKCMSRYRPISKEYPPVRNKIPPERKHTILPFSARYPLDQCRATNNRRGRDGINKHRDNQQ